MISPDSAVLGGPRRLLSLERWQGPSRCSILWALASWPCAPWRLGPAGPAKPKPPKPPSTSLKILYGEHAPQSTAHGDARRHITRDHLHTPVHPHAHTGGASPSSIEPRVASRASLLFRLYPGGVSGGVSMATLRNFSRAYFSRTAWRSLVSALRYTVCILATQSASSSAP